MPPSKFFRALWPTRVHTRREAARVLLFGGGTVPAQALSTMWAAPALFLLLASLAGRGSAADPLPEGEDPGAAATSAVARAEALAKVRGACSFGSEPELQYFWDPSCANGGLGCFADGTHPECRFCGAGDFNDIACPPPLCAFMKEPPIPYFWDSSCETGMLGCFADGVNSACRFCGKAPYEDVKCPLVVGGAVAAACVFADKPSASYFWDVRCSEGMQGCLADGVHPQCRFCGTGPYADIPCPEDRTRRECSFLGQPDVPAYWEEGCATDGLPGCLADGIHVECRYCGAGAYINITCPQTTRATTSEPFARLPGKREGGSSPRLPRGGSSLRTMEGPAAKDSGPQNGTSDVQLSHAARRGSLRGCLLAVPGLLLLARF